jgi:hypothetical protein
LLHVISVNGSTEICKKPCTRGVSLNF